MIIVLMLQAKKNLQSHLNSSTITEAVEVIMAIIIPIVMEITIIIITITIRTTILVITPITKEIIKMERVNMAMVIKAITNLILTKKITIQKTAMVKQEITTIKITIITISITMDTILTIKEIIQKIMINQTIIIKVINLMGEAIDGEVITIEEEELTMVTIIINMAIRTNTRKIFLQTIKKMISIKVTMNAIYQINK